MKIKRVRYRDIEQIPRLEIRKEFKQDFSGSSPAPFIGRFGYPNINIGLLSPQFGGDTSHYDSPRLWSKGNFKIGSIAGVEDVILSRTGYTGEIGFELYVRNEDARTLWDALFSTKIQMKAIGLAARDTLRLEKGFCLYGNDPPRDGK